MLGWVVVTQSLHGTQKFYWMLERSGNRVWSQPPRQAVEIVGTRCFLLHEKDNFWRNSFTPFRSHNSSAWNVLGTASLPWFNNQVLTTACQALPLWHFLLLSPVFTPLKPRWALHYSSIARHIPASQSCSSLLLECSTPRGACGILIYLLHVFTQLSSHSHLPGPPYLKLEDPHLLLYIKLPCLLVSECSPPFHRRILHLWCVCFLPDRGQRVL